MVQNYLKTAFRNIVHQKSSSLLNVAGLTLGITCSLVLFLLVKHLSSYDNFHKNRDRIYRVVTEFDANDGKFHTAGVPTVLPDAFRQDFGEADEVTFLSYRSNALIIIPRNNAVAKKFQEELGVVFAQPNFFTIFDRPLVTGNVARGLDEPKRDLPFGSS